MSKTHSRSYSEGPQYGHQLAKNPYVYQVRVHTSSLKQDNHIHQRIKSLYLQKYKDKLNIHASLKLTPATNDNLALLTTKELDSYIRMEKNRQDSIGSYYKRKNSANGSSRFANTSTTGFSRAMVMKPQHNKTVQSISSGVKAAVLEQGSNSNLDNNSKFYHTRIYQSSFLAKLNKMVGQINTTSQEKKNSAENAGEEAKRAKNDTYFRPSTTYKQQRYCPPFKKTNPSMKLALKKEKLRSNNIPAASQGQPSSNCNRKTISSNREPATQDHHNLGQQKHQSPRFEPAEKEADEKSIASIPYSIDEFEAEMLNKAQTRKYQVKQQPDCWFEGMSRLLLPQAAKQQEQRIRGMDMQKSETKELRQRFNIKNYGNQY